MSKLTPEESLDLKNLVNNSECENNTDHIRKVKHSFKLRDDIRKLELLKMEKATLYQSDPQIFRDLAATHASFLFTNYSDIFNRILKDELNLDIMGGLLGVLNMIEDGKVDQHEGSVMVGKLLKELYVDSALKRSENLDKKNETEVVEKKDAVNKISWEEWKTKNSSK
jgi:hypothetical protein